MTTTEQRPAGFASAFASQFRLIGSLARRDLIIYALAALAVILIASSTNRVPVFHASTTDGGGAEVELFSSDSFGTVSLRGLLGVVFAYLVTGFMAFFWPMSVWRDEGPRRRMYFWSMPVSRFHNHLARVAAGGAWLAGFVTATYALLALGLALSGRGAALASLSTLGWINLVTAPITLYLLTSIAALQSDRPRRTILGFVVLVMIVYAVFGILEFEAGHRAMYWLIEGDMSYGMAVSKGLLNDLLGTHEGGGRWLLAAILWLVAASAAVVWAARRHQER